jgi:hypothetical protein
MVQNAAFALATRSRKLILLALETRSAQDSFPVCSTANHSGTRSHAVPLLARSASRRSVITRGCPTGLGSKRSWKEKHLPADKFPLVKSLGVSEASRFTGSERGEEEEEEENKPQISQMTQMF